MVGAQPQGAQVLGLPGPGEGEKQPTPQQVHFRLRGPGVGGVDAGALFPGETEGDGHDLSGGCSGHDVPPGYVRPGTGLPRCRQGVLTFPRGRPSA